MSALDFENRRAGLPPVIVCPRCDGQLYDRGSCGLCANAGYLVEADGSTLDHVQRMQMAAVLTMSVGLSLCLPSAEVLAARPAGREGSDA